MEVTQLIGRYLRLKHELGDVLRSLPFQRDRARRLATDLAATHLAMQDARRVDEQSDDSMMFATSAFLLPAGEFGEDEP